MLSPKDATERAQRRARLLSKMRHAEKELWDAWERSKQDKETSTKEKVLMPGHASGHAGRGGKTAKTANERNKASIKSEGRLPNSTYMGQLNKIWDREAMLLGMNEPETHDILVKQVQFIEIVRPAPKPGTGEIQPIPPTLTTPTTLTQPETIGQTGQPNGPDGAPPGAVPPPSGVPPPSVAAPSPPDQPSSGAQPPPQDNDRAPDVTKPQDDTGKLRIEVNRPKEVK